MSDVLLSLREVTKRFPGNTALDRVSLSVGRGEVVALLGHNGSGKSTLVKVLSGLYPMDEGEIHRGPQGATALHFIHQNLGLIAGLTVVENLDVVRRHRFAGLGPFARARERRRVEGLVAEFGGTFDVDRRVGTLTTAEQTIVAIARAFDGWTADDNVLVLDEPTAALHGEEVEVLQHAIRATTARGAGIVYISHRLQEVVDLADRVVVLKNGRVVAERERGAFDQRDLVHIIAGAEPDTAGDGRAAERGAVRLRARDLRADSLQGIDLDAHAGEVLGLSGLVGSGIETLNSVLFGATPLGSGDLEVDGVVLRSPSPADAIRAGLAFVPADRRSRGSIGTFTARENLTLPRLGPLRRRTGTVDVGRERRDAGDWMDRVKVLPVGSSEQRFDLFSGGNQQKIVLAKWLRMRPGVLLLDEPTQGVDAGAQAEIYALLLAAARDGAAVIVASSDTKELAALCDRVLVLREGRVVDEFARDRLTESALVRAVVDDSAAMTESRMR